MNAPLPLGSGPGTVALPMAGTDLTKNRRAFGSRHAMILLVLPLLFYMLVFYAYPVAAMLSRSLLTEEGWTISVFISLLGDAIFWRVLGITMQISLAVTLLCLLLAYPVAYAFARMRQSHANLMMILVLTPFWTSILVRTYAWMALLGRRGIINNALVASGLIDTPLWAGMADEARATMFDNTARRLPARRIGQPGDIAQAVLFVATNPFVTGTTVTVDGGGTIA